MSLAKFFQFNFNLATQFAIMISFGLLTASAAWAQPGGGPDTPDKEILKDFDADNNGRLNTEERAKARESLKSGGGGFFSRFGGPPQGGPGGRGRGPGGRGGRGPGGRGGNRPAGTEGPAVSPADVKSYPDAKLYDPNVLRTVFIDFEADDWEAELADFKPTDVEVPATLTVDGKKYPEVGVSFRGASSYFSIPAGSKRSFNLSMDFADDKQKLYGYKTLNLLNCNGDASLMSSFLYADVTSKKIATPKVNFVKVVVNGRSWGIYANVQQFNKDFLEENFETQKGARWKVSGSPRGDAGLRYIGDDIKAYRAKYEIKSKDKEESWKALIELCKVLNETPLEELESALEPILDIDGVLWFLAADVALINSDGYWTRASDYSIYRDPKGKFHILPHDMNESFRASRGGGGPGGPGGPGGRGIFGGFGGGRPQGGPPQDGFGRPQQDRGPQDQQRPRGEREQGQQDREPQNRGDRAQQERGQGERQQGRPQRGEQGRQGGNNRQATNNRGYELDPMINMTQRFPLRSRLLEVPALKERYLKYLREIASNHISWDHLGPKVKRAASLIKDEVKADTRKLMANEAFENAVSESDPPKPGSLQEFAEQRSKYLLEYPEIKELAAPKKQ